MKKNDLGQRKAKHLQICLDTSLPLEGPSSGFEDFTFLHKSLPEIDADMVDLTSHMFGKKIALPLFISSMTGGSDEGFKANKELAISAQKAGIPVGMGSIRILFEEEEVFPHFHLKKYAPDVPVFANLGFVQIRDMNHKVITEMLKRLEVQGIAVHMNAAQELFQPEGDRNFKGIYDGLARFCEISPIPVMVKETGMGIGPSEVRRLKEAGAYYVNVAGAGGTNWALVEAYRHKGVWQQAALEFADWGLPTAHILYSLGSQVSGVVASGGLRTGMDVAKSLALGAQLAGMALPFIRIVKERGHEGILEKIEEIKKVLWGVCVLTGNTKVSDLNPDLLVPSARALHLKEQWKNRI